MIPLSFILFYKKHLEISMFIDSTPADSTVNRNMQRDYARCLKRIPKITARIWRDTLTLLPSILLYAIVYAILYCILYAMVYVPYGKAKYCKGFLFRGKSENRQPEKLVFSQTKNRKFRSICGRRIEGNMNGHLYSTNHLGSTILWILPAGIRQTVGGQCCQTRGKYDSKWKRGKDCEDERFGLHEDAMVFIRIPLAPFTCSSSYLPPLLNGSDTETYAIKVWKIYQQMHFLLNI